MIDDKNDQGLRQQLAEEESSLARLEKQRDQTLARIRSLRGRLQRLECDDGAVSTRSSKIASSRDWTSAEKLELFAQRFRGRQHVFAKRWTNRRSGRSGYAPACRNEWIRGVCEKPRVRCGECPNQAFVPVTDQVLLDHLLGRSVAGVYPLLPDDTCWFLAADFDGDAWRQDVLALMATCRQLDLTPAIERSRSGRGAHAWFFFGEPVAAAAARNLGCLVITETMSSRHELPMTSYDRLFPSQDTLPRGGFGNLIALPFQDGPRQEGNSVFLDEDLKPHADQWAYLASTPRISATTLHGMLADAYKRGGVLRIAVPANLDEDLAKPWTRRPSGRVKEPRITGPLPKRIEAVLAQRLFVEKAGLPSPLLSRIKRLAAFQNPEFYKKQNLRLSTALTPRIISCAEDFPVHVALPRGCLPEFEKLLADHRIELALRDERTAPKVPDFEFDGELTGVQSQAAEALLEHETGVLVAPPGSGKTVVGVYLVAERRTTTLILVHRRPLAEQWRTQLALFLGIPEREIGRIGGGRNKPNGRLDDAPEPREERVVLATGRYIGEGFDDPRLDTLFLAMPISWKGTLIQYVGRLHRSRTGKSEVLVYDYVDRKVPMLARMFDKRLRTYRAMGYSVAEGR